MERMYRACTAHVQLSRVRVRRSSRPTAISFGGGGRCSKKSCMIRPFPCVWLAPTQTGQGSEMKAGKVASHGVQGSPDYANSLYPLSDLSIIAESFLGA
jgi:hypothetical protein